MPDVPILGGLLALTTATPEPVNPSPSPTAPAFDPNDVTPGTIGFVVTFAMVIVVIFLLRDLSKRIRRINLKGEEAERLAAEAATRAASAKGAPGKTAAGPDAQGATSGGQPRGAPTPGGRRPPSLKKPSGGTTAPTG